MADLGLRLDAANIVDFGPVALSRVAAARQRESSERKRLEAISAANFDAQARTHASVLDLIASQDHADLAGRIDAMARGRFGLVAGVLAVEGPMRVPAGWRALVEGQVDLILGPGAGWRMGARPHRPLACSTTAPVRSEAWPWCGSPCGRKGAQASWPSARPTRRRSPPRWAPIWWPSWRG